MGIFTYAETTVINGVPGVTKYRYKTALDEGESSTGKIVLESHETLTMGDILASGRLLPVTDYHVYRDKTSGTHGSIMGNHKIHSLPTTYLAVSGYDDCCASFTVTHGEGPAPDWSRLRTEAMARANSATFDLLTNLAELPESVSMARNFMRNLEDRIRRIRNLRKVRASRSFEEFVRVFSGAWLEYRYGWRPLVGSIRDLAEAVNDLGKEKIYVPVSGRSTTVTNGTGPINATWSNMKFGGYVRTNTSSRTSTHRSFVTHLIGKYSAAIGAQPLVTAWELVPYSFVIDWFTGIGDTIQAQYKPPGVIQTIAGSSTKTISSGTTTSTRETTDWSVVRIPGSFTKEREEYTRWADPIDPPPPAIFSQMDRMSLAQWADLVFLAEGALRRAFQS